MGCFYVSFLAFSCYRLCIFGIPYSCNDIFATYLSLLYSKYLWYLNRAQKPIKHSQTKEYKEYRTLEFFLIFMVNTHIRKIKKERNNITRVDDKKSTIKILPLLRCRS